jgi:hypothetical protein
LVGAVSWVAAALLAASFLVPDHFLPWVSWHSEVIVFAAVLLLSWAAILDQTRTGALGVISVPFVAAPCAVLVLIAIVQRAAGAVMFNGDVWVLSFYMAMCIACACLGRASSTKHAAARPESAAPDEMIALAVALAFAALASTVIALAQEFDVWNTFDWIFRMPELRRPGANLAQPNHLATLQVMGVASLLFLRAGKKAGQTVIGVCLLLLGIGLASTESRAGALSVLALFGWWLWKRRAAEGRNAAFQTLAWAGAFPMLFIAWPHLLNAVNLSGDAEARVTEGSLRFSVWPQLLHAVAIQPWTGWGFRQVAAAHDAVLDQHVLISEAYAYSHNLLIDFAIWVGVPLALAFALAAGAYLWRCTRRGVHLPTWYGLAVAIPLGVHSMLEYPFAYAYFLAPVVFLLGGVEATVFPKPLFCVRLKPAALALGAISLAMCWSAVEYLGIEEDFRVARFEALHIGATAADYHPPTVWLLDQLAILLDDARIEPKPNMSAQEMQVVRKAALYYPWSATEYRYAMALALNGNLDEAAREFHVLRLFWGDKAYSGVKRKIGELAATEYPQLRGLELP